VNAPILIPAAVSLRTAFNVLAPSRDKASDGWIGDTAHQHEVSDHNPDETGNVPIHDPDRLNEVHAVDVDSDLNVPGLTMDRVVSFIIKRCKTGLERRLRYVIWDHVIWSASNAWQPRPYQGPSPHTEHAHFSFSYDTALEADMASWHLEEIPVALTNDDKTYISGAIAGALSAALPVIAETVYRKFRAEKGAPWSDTAGHNLMTDIVNNQIAAEHGGQLPQAWPEN
jgi:hypothetical protein